MGGVTSDDAKTSGNPFRRRALLAAGIGVGIAGAASIGVASGTVEVPHRVRRVFADTGPDGVVPDAVVGEVRLETRSSEARSRDVGFWTAVPAGHGDGTGLPVCMILHGASATTARYTDFGFPQFLTASVDAGHPPFVLVGADGGRIRWERSGDDDPQEMLRSELPRWCAERGYDVTRLAAYGWSMGGYGALRLAQRSPDLLRGLAVLSPAIDSSDAVFDDVERLDGDRVAVWCGEADSLFPAAEDLADEIDPAVAEWARGGHTRGYWNRVTPDAFAFVAASLTS